MATTLVVNTPPYGSEGPYNALRLAEALLVKDEWVELFFMGDAVQTGRAGQEPRGAHARLDEMLVELIDKGAQVTLCGTCCRARGLTEAELIEGVKVGTIHDLAGLVLASGRTLSF